MQQQQPPEGHQRSSQSSFWRRTQSSASKPAENCTACWQGTQGRKLYTISFLLIQGDRPPTMAIFQRPTGGVSNTPSTTAHFQRLRTLAHASTHSRMCLHGSRLRPSRFIFAAPKVMRSHSDLHPSLAWTLSLRYSDTVHPDSTLDVDDTQATVSDSNKPSAHPRLRSVFGYFAERASPTGYEPNEQLEDLTSHNLRRCRVTLELAQSYLSSGSMSEVAATTIPGTELNDQARRYRMRQRYHGHRFSPREGQTHSASKRITKFFISSETLTRNSCCSSREILKEVFVLKHQYQHLSHLRS